MNSELVKDIESGLYCYKMLVRRYPDLTPWQVMQVCTLHNLGLHRKNTREALLISLQRDVCSMWAEGVKDPEIALRLNVELKTVKAVRTRFGYLNDVTGIQEQRRSIIREMYTKGESEKDIVKAVEAETGEPMTTSALRSFVYRERIMRPVTYVGYDTKLMDKLRPFFLEHPHLSDAILALKVDASRNTIMKYRKILLSQLIEKEKAAS